MLNCSNGPEQACCLQGRVVHKKPADSASGNYENGILLKDEFSDGSKKPAAQTAQPFAEL